MSTVTISGINRTTDRIGRQRGTRTLDQVRGGAAIAASRVADVSSAAAGVSSTAGAAAGPRWTRWIGIGLTGAGLAMVPWLGVLATGLPASYHAGNWNAAWVGLDALEALGLFATGTLLRRRDPRAALTAAATSALLCVDAWFDVLTSAPADRVTAIVMAAGAELPITALCAVLAVRTFPQR
ncbi:MAG TPA: hypothetical protein VGZ32_26885 [Actinocrinis sp.]|jgi:hypothetical protein|uniref:hypothetical protein n=1 Tax=Actinocrinis sp. TaxID=1920516 RepID=UPI002DDD9E04|nr:hypothetical protein [Actinocrinis sp.]HEV3174004.1 hypothetical protein [Actinocrinis sp.]